MRVGWLDRMTGAPFKKDTNGRDIFFPWGKLGAGRVIPSKADGTWIRWYLGIYFVCAVITAVPVIVIGRIFRTSIDLATGAPFVGAFVIVLIVPWLVLWLRVRSWPVAGEREMSGQQVLSRAANEIGPVFLWIGTLGSGLMFALFLYILLVSDETWSALLGLTFFGACFGFLARLLRVRQRG